METILPSIFDEFMCGHFVALLTTSLFAGMALDQVLEQLNCKIKAVLGSLNLLNRDDEGKSLLSWALSCPEILRLLEEYEKKPNAGTTEHHSNYKQLQLDYKEDCLKFKSSWMCCLCPFLDSTPAETLCYAHNGRPLPNNKVLVESGDAMLPLGKQQSLDYTHNGLVLCKTPITAPISKNSFILPGNVVSSASSFLKTMTERKDRRLMLHVKSAVQFREEEVRKALKFMPGSVPSTFTHNNRLFQSPKSVLLRRFKSPSLSRGTTGNAFFKYYNINSFKRHSIYINFYTTHS